MQTALLLNPPAPRPVFRDHYCASESKGGAYLWHPLDLLIQGACLKDAGYDLIPIDAIALQLDLDALLKRLEGRIPDVALVLVSRRSWIGDKITLWALKNLGIKTIVASGDFLRFGEAPVDEAEGLVDFVLTDFTTHHLAQSLKSGAPAGGGVATLEDVKAGEFRDLGRQLLAYPCPDPDLFAPAAYRLPYPGFTPIASILTTYGCPHHCKYCHVGELGARLRDPGDILEEVALAKARGYNHIYFRDATLNANRAHIATWARAMARQGLATPWASFATARPMDDALARDLKASGCQHLQIGLETPSDDLRDHNNKPFDGDAHREFFDICNRNGIEVTAHMVMGLPGEDEASLKETVRAIAKLPVSYVAVNLAEQRPGLPWGQEGILLPVDPMGKGGEGGTVEGSALDLPTLERYRDQAYRRFYLRPQRLRAELSARIRTGDLGDTRALIRSAGGWLKGALPKGR